MKRYTLVLMKDIARVLVEYGVVRTNFETPFVWTSGIKSPIYCDCRELTGLVEAREAIVTSFLETISQNNLPADVIAGTATAGISWAAFVAQRLEKPMLYVRPKPKGYGAGKQVEGRTTIKNPRVLVVEDAFSTGGSSIRSAKALEKELNAEVTHILGIFSWDTPAFFENRKKSGLNMMAFTNFDEIIEALYESGKITEIEKEHLIKFHAHPEDWWERR